MMAALRLLSPDDRESLEAFLRGHAADAMILRSNLARSGIVDGPEPFQGRYAGAFDDGRIIAAAAHYWNGMLILCAPGRAGELAGIVTEGRRVSGILGPWDQALEAQEALGLGGSECRLRSREILMSLSLDALRMPAPLLPGQALQCRLAQDEDLDLLAQWRAAFRMESLCDTPSRALVQHCRAEVARWIEEKSQFLLFDGERPVSCCSFNARLPDAVQIGNVWTPRKFRSRGYGRAVVAWALEHAKREGASLGILFTPQDNEAALTAYTALGFSAVGDYAMLLYR